MPVRSRATEPIYTLVLLLALTAGCGPPALPSSSAPEALADYASLPRLQATHHPALRKELARLLAEDATPAQLAPSWATADDLDDLGHPPTPYFDATAPLQALFPEDQLKTLRIVDDIYPEHAFELGRRLPAAQEVVRNQASALAGYRRLLQHERLQFVVDHRLGITADLSFVDGVQRGNRLLGLVIADRLEHGLLNEVVDELALMFHGIEALARVDHVVPRTAAVHRRHEALEILRALANHPQCDASLLSRLLDLIEPQLRRWPADGPAWIGDRAIGLHTYELIRAGYLLSLLHYSEIRQLSNEIGIEKLGPLIMQNLDADEWFYLQSMRRLIAACDDPYYERVRVFDALDRELESQRKSSVYGYVADQLLLVDVQAGQRWQALDRARVMAWQLALSAALGEVVLSPKNPLTGVPFIIEPSPTRLLVDGIDPAGGEPPIVIPRPGHP